MEDGRQLAPPRCGNGPAPAVTGGAAVPQSDGCTGSEWVGPRHHRGTAVEHHAGIDVSLERSSVCVVDATGRIVREAKVASEPEALVDFFRRLGLPLARVGLEAGPLSQWLHAGLAGAGFEAVLLETRQVKAALSAMIVKTDCPPRAAGRSGTPGQGCARHRPALAHGLVPAGAPQVAAGAGGPGAAGRAQALAGQAAGRGAEY